MQNGVRATTHDYKRYRLVPIILSSYHPPPITIIVNIMSVIGDMKWLIGCVVNMLHVVFVVCPNQLDLLTAKMFTNLA
jgi:hypothetical protein